MRAEVHALREITPGYFVQGFIGPGLPRGFHPGQFLMVKPLGSLDPFLPRAYSILRVLAGRPHVVEILYRVMGRGTIALSQLRRGEPVEILGPLGRGFTLPEKGTHVLLVAGGVGVPPIVALAEALAKRAHPRLDHRAILVEAFVGGQTAADVLCVRDLRRAGARVLATTDDGSLGRRGLITDLLEARLRALARPAGSAPRPASAKTRRAARAGHPIAIYACGPEAMLRAVARLALSYGTPAQLSMEASMACGFGACMGCVIPVRSSGFTVHGSRFGVPGKETSMNHELSTVNQRSYKLCCTDGPVFDAGEIAW